MDKPSIIMIAKRGSGRSDVDKTIFKKLHFEMYIDTVKPLKVVD